MQTSFPAILQLITLNLSEKSDEDFMCSISLMKGMQNFGEIKFQIDQEYTEYAFTDQKIIKFFYAPRLTTRRDVFFKIILTDIQSKQQMGEIPISTHLLAEKFKENSAEIIEKNVQFLEGVSLSYKIYQPVTKLQTKQSQFGFKNVVEKDDFIGQLFAGPESVENQINIIPKGKASFHINSLKTSLVLPINKKDKVDESTKVADNNAVSNQDAQKKPSTFASDVYSSQFVRNMLMIVNKSSIFKEKKRHTLNTHNFDHHGSHHLSKKLKVVIFLLIFGFLITLFEFITDKQSPSQKTVKKAKKSLNKKASASHL